MPDYLLGLIVGVGLGIVATLIGVCVEGYLHKRAAAGVAVARGQPSRPNQSDAQE